jgi:hypothetical protein
MGKKESAVRMGDESTSWNGSCRSYMYEGGDFELDHINKAISRSKFTRSPISHNSLPWYMHYIVSLEPCEITPPIMQL